MSYPREIDDVREILAACEAPGASIWSAINAVSRYVGGERAAVADKFNDMGAYLDAAAALLPAGAVWRAYTDRSVSVYGASPYNAASQECFDGFADQRALAICAAYLRMLEAPLAKAQAAELRKAGAAASIAPAATHAAFDPTDLNDPTECMTAEEYLDLCRQTEARTNMAGSAS